MTEQWGVFARNGSDQPGEMSTWRLVTAKPTREQAEVALANFRKMNPDTPAKLGDVEMQHQSWSVYESNPAEGRPPGRMGYIQMWRWVSEWPNYRDAQKALRIKRLLNSKMAYQIFRTGYAPDPTTDRVDIAVARQRQERADLIAEQILGQRAGNPNRCSARRRGEDSKRALCILDTDHVQPHQTAYEKALEILREAEEGSHGESMGGQTSGRKWYPPHSYSGREAMEPFRPLDPAEDPNQRDEDIRPPGEGSYQAGDPNRTKRGGNE